MKKKNYEYYETKEIYNLKTFIEYSAEVHKNKVAFIYENRKVRVEKSFSELKIDVEAMGTILNTIILYNCNIAILGENSYPWIVTFLAIACGGNTGVLLDKDLSSQELSCLITDSKSKVIVYSETYADIIKAFKEESLPIDHFISLENFEQLINKGKEIINEGKVDYIKYDVIENQVAALLYTSGTTGKSKGVLLSHRNIMNNVVVSCKSVECRGSTLLVLPLYHALGIVGGMLGVLMHGQSVYINSSLKKVATDIVKAKPQYLALVPLFIEIFYNNIWNKVKEDGKEKQLRALIKLSNILLSFGIDLRRKIFKKILDALGGNLEVIVSGGAPIDVRYIKGFRDFGVNVLNGYGITECGVVVSVNRNKYYRDGSVGIPLCGCQVKIEDKDIDGIGEILVKSDSVMKEYYNNWEETENVFENSWFKTGDIGWLDKKNFLYISGRKKNLIILSNGQNVAPEELEQKILYLPYVKEVIVYDKKGVITAEVYLNEDICINASTKISEDILQINELLPIYKNIGKIIVRDVEFEKTTLKKIKRKVEKVG